MFEYEIYKLKRKHKETLSLGEFKDTLNKAIQLANILLKKSIDDILNAVNEDAYVDVEPFLFTWDVKHIIHKLLSRYKPNFASEERNIVEYIESYNIELYNLDLFNELTRKLYDIKSIIYKGESSELSLTNIKKLNIQLNMKYGEKTIFWFDYIDTIEITDRLHWLDMPQLEEERITLDTSDYVIDIFDNKQISAWQHAYYELKNFVDKLVPIMLNNQAIEKTIMSEKSKIKIENNDFFVKKSKDSPAILKHFYNPEIIKLYDLSEINFNNVNISGLDISNNPEVHINFDKIVKDVSGCNFNGYNLSKVTFRNFNIKDTDFSNTKAIIDLESCILNHEGKMSSGTIFDEDNRFLFGDKKLTLDQVKDLGIKIKKLERN